MATTTSGPAIAARVKKANARAKRAIEAMLKPGGASSAALAECKAATAEAADAAEAMSLLMQQMVADRRSK
jgi:hypothetical protein